MCLAACAGLLAGLALVAACKQREGKPCRCADDCRDGLLCVVDGRALDSGSCSAGGRVGSCLPDETDGNGDDLDPMVEYDDMPSKKDLGGPATDDDGSDTGVGTTGGGTTGGGTTGGGTTGGGTTGGGTTGGSTTGGSTGP